MIRSVSSTIRAVPALMAGIAFFLAACQPKTTPPVTVEEIRPDPLVLAESYVKQGELEKALEAYRGFLQDAPKNETSALALKRTSEIYLKLNQPAKALTVLEEICRDYPDIPWIAGVRYDVATVLSRIGEHRRSATAALSWLDRYPHHPLKRDVYLLLGENFSALGDKAEAFHWWLMAKTLWESNSEEAAAAALEDLANAQKVMAVIGPLSSTAAVAAARKSQETGVPIITLSQREGIVEEGDMVFRNLLTPAQEIKGLLDVAVNRMGLKRFGILYPDNAYGRYCMETFWGRLEQMGGIVTAAESYAVDQTDFADEIKKMVGLHYPRAESLVKKSEDMRTQKDEESIIHPEKPEPIIDFDAIFIPDTFQRVAMIAPQLVFHDVLGVQLLGTSAWQSPKLLEMAKDYIQGAVFCSGFAPNAGDPDVRAFVDAYRENFDGDPDILAANGYDTIRLLKKLLAEESIRTRRDLAAALLGSQGFKGVSGIITFDSRGEADKDPILLKISGNTLSILN